MRSRILLISGRYDEARDLSHMLQGLPFSLEYVTDLQHARVTLRRDEFDAVLTEAALPDGSWLDVLHLARDCPQDLKVIVTDPQADARLWSEALNRGAYDLIAQPFYEPEVRRILSLACSPEARAPMAAV